MHILPGFTLITFRGFFFFLLSETTILIHFSLQTTSPAINPKPFSYYAYSIKLKWSLGLSFNLLAISWSDKEMFVPSK